MIKLTNVTKKYGNNVVFEGFDFFAEDKKITVVLGESGAGKTTLLNILANTTEFSGSVEGIDGISMVFQKDRLVPHLTVEENIKLVSPNADVSALLESVKLNGVENYYPKNLSAGMARRVAILRAFSYDAPVVLMDEPLINLDLSLKYLLIDQIKELSQKYGKTVILVTHDILEAVKLADRIVVLEKGKTVYEESPVTDKTEKNLTDILLKNYKQSKI